METNVQPDPCYGDGASGFCELLDGVRAGSREAALELQRRHRKHLMAVVEHQILRRDDPRHRRLDPEDFVQEGWRALFAGLRQGKTFADERAMIAFIVTAMINHSRNDHRKHAAAGEKAPPNDVSFEVAQHDIPAPGPGPAERAELADECRCVLAGLQAEARAVMQLIYAGFTKVEVAGKLGLSPRKVRRVVQQVQRQFAKRHQVSGAPIASQSQSLNIAHGDWLMAHNNFPVPAPTATDPAQAEQHYCQLVRDNPKHVEAWFQLGLIALRQTQHGLAIERLEKAAALDPAQDLCHHYLGICHQALGQLDRALPYFTRFAQRQPDNPDAHNNLGLTFAQLGRHDEAAACFERSLRIKPDSHEARGNLGNVLAERGKLPESIAHYRQAIALNPGYADAHRNLGMALRRQGQPEEALASFQQALAINPRFWPAHIYVAETLVILQRLDDDVAAYRNLLRIKPDHPHAHGLLAQTLTQQGKFDDAIAALQQGLVFHPGAPAIHHMLGTTFTRVQRLDEAGAAYRNAIAHKPDFYEAHVDLGNTHLRQQNYDAARGAYSQAITLQPNRANAHCNLGVAFVQEDRFLEAIACLNEALRLDPQFVEALHNLATAYRRLGRNEEAETVYNRTLELNPKHAEARCGLGAALVQQARSEEALTCFEQAISLHPQNADFNTNAGLMLLLIEDFARAWDAYEWRLKQKRIQPRLAPQPVWDGTALPSGTILVYAEQGIGDTFQFVRYLRMVKARVGTVLFECPAPLHGVLAGCAGIDGFVDPTGPAPAADVQIPLMSLPRIFATRIETIPAQVPYLYTEAVKRERWRKELAGPASRAGPGGAQEVPLGSRDLRVGIVWQGNAKHPGDPFRSVKLTQFAKLAAVAGVKLYSLQKGLGRSSLRRWADSSRSWTWPRRSRRILPTPRRRWRALTW